MLLTCGSDKYERLEHIHHSLGFRILAAVRQNGLQQVAGASVMQEKDALAETPAALN